MRSTSKRKLGRTGQMLLNSNFSSTFSAKPFQLRSKTKPFVFKKKARTEYGGHSIIDKERILQGELAELDKKLNSKVESKPFSFSSKKSMQNVRNPKFDYTGLSNTTATTMGRTREIKKDEFDLGFSAPKYSSVAKKTFSKPKKPMKDEWDFDMFGGVTETTKPKGSFLDRFSKKMKKDKQIFQEDFHNQRTKKQKDKQVRLAQKMANTMDREKNIIVDGNDEELVGQRNMVQNLNLELEAEDAEFEQLFKCQKCDRTFKRTAFKKHKKVCQVVFKKPRVPFEKKEQKRLSRKGDRKKKTEKKSKANNKNKWKKKSEGLRALIKKKGKNKKKKELEIELVI